MLAIARSRLLAAYFPSTPAGCPGNECAPQEEDHLVGYFLDKTHDVGGNQNVFTRSFSAGAALSGAA